MTLSKEDVYRLRSRDRFKCRTDLLFLAKKVLGYDWIDPDIHNDMIRACHQFVGGTDKWDDKWNLLDYTPKVPLWEQLGPRKTLILWPRGHLKTTIITIAQTVQWILNYPDIRILISTAVNEQAKKILGEIKAHFQFSVRLRFLFPEFCPIAEHVKDWGSQEAFTVPCRKRKALKEHTVSVCSVGSVVAGAHYEVIINSDLVDKENVRTPGGIREVIEHFGYLNPLLERGPVPPHNGWIFVEGTRYAFGDLYGVIQDDEAKKSDADKLWNIQVRDAEVGPEKALWPTRFPWKVLKDMENDPTMGPSLYAAQMRNKPIAAGAGLCDEKDIQWISRQALGAIMPMLRLHVTIDLAGMEPDKLRADFTVLTLAGFDRDGRMYVIEVRRGHFSPFDVIGHIFDIHKKYPQIQDFKIEKDAHARVLLPFLQRECSKRGQFPMVVPLTRDTHTSKQQRIRGLQAWFKTNILRFCDEIACKSDLILEILRFPTGQHDDILDTIADQMYNRDMGVIGDVVPMPPELPNFGFGTPKPKERFLGFDPISQDEMWSGDLARRQNNWQHELTGL